MEFNFAAAQNLVWGWLVIPAAFALWGSWKLIDKRRRMFASSARVCNRRLSKSRAFTKAVLLLTAVLLTVFALARPRWGFEWLEMKTRGVDIMIALDVSRSMMAEDVKPNRLERAKREVVDLLNITRGDRVGLVAFSGVGFVQCPLTADYAALKMFLDLLDPSLIPVPGTAIGMALNLSLKSLRDASSDSTEGKAIILMTDGEDADPETKEMVEEARKAGVKVFVLGIGSDAGAPIPEKEGGFKKDASGGVVISKLDEKLLTFIAEKTGGVFTRSISGDGDLERIYNRGIKVSSEDKELTTTREKLWRERYQWFLLAAIFFVVAEFFISDGKKLAVIALLLMGGFTNEGAFAKDVKEAYKAYGEKKYEQAAKEFLDAEIDEPDNLEHVYNRAVSEYRAGKFDAARDGFARSARSKNPKMAQDSLFNLGNSEAMAGNDDGAIAAYEEALKLNPEDKRAAENLEYVKQRKEQKQQDKENNKDDKNQDDKKDNQDKENDEKKGDQQNNKDEKGENDNKNKDSKDSEDQKNQGKEEQGKDEKQKQKDEESAKESDKEQQQKDQKQQQAEREAKAKEGKDKDEQLNKMQAERVLGTVEDEAGKYLSRPLPEDAKKAKERGVEQDW
jgi:Ca-activated chloride channel family protein